MNKKPIKFSPEVRARAVRLVHEQRGEHAPGDASAQPERGRYPDFESLVTAKLISRGKLEVNIMDVDSSGRGLGGLYRFGMKEIDIYRNAFSTPTQAAGYATHETTHFMQRLTRSNYNLGHEFDAFRAQGAVDLRHWTNGLSDSKLYDLLGTHSAYRGVRPDPNWPC